MFNWSEYNERMVRRGEILFNLDFVKNIDKELEEMNRGFIRQSRYLFLTFFHLNLCDRTMVKSTFLYLFFHIHLIE